MTTFTIFGQDGCINEVTITEKLVDGKIVLEFTITQQNYTGDYLGLFFDFFGPAPTGLVATGDDVTAQDFDEDNLTQAGDSANNMEGTGVSFDLGIQFGEPGNDEGITSTTFTLSADGDLSISDFITPGEITYGFRVQSTGESGQDSKKTVGDSDQIDPVSDDGQIPVLFDPAIQPPEFEFAQPSNLVLYLWDPDSTDDCDIVKVKFEGSSDFDGLDTNNDGFIDNTEIFDWIGDNVENHTELYAFSVKDGTTLSFEGGAKNSNTSPLGPGEGQLVFMDDSGFEVEDGTIQDDVTFTKSNGGFTSLELAGSCLDPATTEGALLLKASAFDDDMLPDVI